MFDSESAEPTVPPERPRPSLRRAFPRWAPGGLVFLVLFAGALSLGLSRGATTGRR